MSGPSRHRVALPPGRAWVTLQRAGMGLGERGGFEAVWCEDEEAADEALPLEAFRSVVKHHLAEVYREREGGEPPGVTLNLASHQLVDDLLGWSKLNPRS